MNVAASVAIAIACALCTAAFADDEAWRGKGWCRLDYPPDAAPPPRSNLPGWVCNVANEKRLDAKYAVYERVNPFFVSGDFDGDGKTDAAVWVRNKRTDELGVVIIHRGNHAVFVLGAGEKDERGGDWRVFDQWTIYPKAPLGRSSHEPPPAPKLRGDALWFAKSESASFFVYWDGKRYKYYTESD